MSPPFAGVGWQPLASIDEAVLEGDDGKRAAPVRVASTPAYFGASRTAFTGLANAA